MVNDTKRSNLKEFLAFWIYFKFWRGMAGYAAITPTNFSKAGMLLIAHNNILIQTNTK